MKILWITNILLPDICKELHRTEPVTGGWMKSLLYALLDKDPHIEIGVATLYGANKPLLKKKIGRVTYFCLPYKECQTKYNPQMEITWKEIATKYNPDIIHIHGTEFPYGLAYLKANGGNNAVVSLQGLVGAYARYSLGNISKETLKRYKTLYDMLRNSILTSPERMTEQGKMESEYLSYAHHVIGRTIWDNAHTWALNPLCKYHTCNEVLRTPFYNSKKWDIEHCKKHSIFLSQAQKPIKGIHKLIEAMPLILREYKDTKVYIAGSNFLRRKSLKEKLSYSTYANYIRSLIKKYNLEEKLIFTGLLDEQEMAEQYRLANVFICPSSIENSPNSLGEAQLIGVPCIAAYVGGIPSMIEDGKSGLLYQFDEHEILAKHVCEIFRNKELAMNLSKNGINTAQKRHDKTKIAEETINIYNEILNKN